MARVGNELPNQDGKAGKYLKTDGFETSWEDGGGGGGGLGDMLASVYDPVGKASQVEVISNKKTDLSDNSDTFYPSQKAVKTAVDGKQATLVSATNIKTINSISLLGSGNINTPNTEYTASSFDIKDLTDSTSLRSSWTGKQNALGFTPENVTNKVTAFSSPTDTQYPSAKLVKDQLDGKQASGTYSTDIHSNITALDNVSGVNTGDQDLSGKEDVGVAQGLMTAHTNAHPAPTNRDTRNQIAGTYLTDHQDISGKEDTSNKSTNVITDATSDTKYPSVKAVKTYVDENGGGGGAVDWIAKSSAYTAVNGDGILANTSSGAWTLTLPATPTVGDVIGINDANSTFHTNNLTIARNGNKIHSLAEDLVVDLKDASFLLVYSGATTGWKLDTYLQVGSEAYYALANDATPKLGGDLNADNKNINSAKTIGFNSEVDNGSKEASFTVDFANAQKQKTTLTANTLTLTLDTTDVKVGNYLLKVVNGGLATLTWASESGSIYWAGGTKPALTGSGTDLIAFYFDGVNFYGQGSLAFS